MPSLFWPFSGTSWKPLLPSRALNSALQPYFGQRPNASFAVSSISSAGSTHAASIIAMAGDTVEMMIGSQLMIHDAMVADCGNARELREIAKWLDNQSDNIAGIYAERGRDKTAQEWRALMLAETWMFADEAVEMGLANSVYTRQVKQALEEAGIDPTEEEETTGEEMPEEEMVPEEETPEEEAKALALLMAKRHTMTNRGYKYSSRDKAPSPLAHRGIAKRSNKDDEFERIHATYQRALAGR